MSITKAEILWTRVCPLKCSYCNMATGERNSRTIEDWTKGLFQLKALGCKFAAFYGAEPLADFNNLPEVVGAAESMGIDTTVITSGCIPDLQGKLKTLHSKGAKSLSMSYDVSPTDQYSIKKSNIAIDSLLYFKSLGNIRDVAAISTITKANYQGILGMIEKMSKHGIWTFFDLIHPDLQHPGSKCKGDNFNLEFRSKEDIEKLITVLEVVMIMKDRGYLCHTTQNFLDTLITLKENPYSWCCADHKEFPSWVTINPDGTVQPCDDFQLPDISCDMTKLQKQWPLVSVIWKEDIKKYNCSCLWNTHIDSHAVKQGAVDINQYVHGK